jgi:hypothetical protein
LVDESALTIAGKRRHLFLLEKIRENKPLTRAEVAELGQYERGMEGQGQHTDAAQAGQAPVPRSKLAPDTVRQAAMVSASMSEAGERLGVVDLAARLEKSKRLTAAWDRGQLLRRVQEIASTTMIVAEKADRALGLAAGEFVTILATDRIVRDLWEQSRFEFWLQQQQSMAKKVAEGDARAAAIFQQLFPEVHAGEGGADLVDFTRLSPTQMEKATGVLRQQILRWHKQHGLPRNADHTYSMPAFVTWLERFTKAKISGQASPGTNPLTSVKAERLELELRKRKGELVEVEAVTEGLFAREKALVAVLEHKPEELSHVLEGKTRQQIKPVLEKFTEDLRREWAEAIKRETENATE